MEMVGFAPSLAFLMLILGGGVGLPLGVPPAPEDPFYAQIAPEQCLYYSSWAGTARPDPQAQNATERLLAEQEVQQVIAQLNVQLQQFLQMVAQQNGDPESFVMADTAPVLAKLLVTQPVATFVSSLDVDQDHLDIEGAMVVGLGEDKAAVQAALAKINRLLVQRGAEGVTIANQRFTRMELAEDTPVTWGIFENHLIIGIGAQTVEGVIERAKTPAPKWLVDLQKKYHLPRRATFTYGDLRGMLSSVSTLNDPQAALMLDALGLSQLQSYIAITGLDEEQYVSRTFITLEGQPRGLLALLPAEPLSAQDLKPIPRDALMAIAVRIDSERVLDSLLELARSLEPSAATQVQQMLQFSEDQFGVRPREDVLSPLGDVWRLYTTAGDGGLLTGWTLTVSLDDAVHLTRTHDKLVNIYRGAMLQVPDMPRIASSEYGAHEIHSLLVPVEGFPLAPAWCITEQELVVGLFPQTIKAHLNRADAEQSLADIPVVAQQLESGQVGMLSYMDTPAVFTTLYPFGLAAAHAWASVARSEGVDIDLTALPSAHTVAQHLQPSLMTLERTDQGLLIQRQQTMPGGSLGAAAPVLTALLLPAVQSARAASARMASSNNLKQIMLALHNYHDTHTAFPSQYNADADGKPLLSWRVHILPFVEQAALYEQFHLDEPWDSPHNRKLIPQMPQVYRAPGSKADPGKTNYLGLAGADGIFLPPEEQHHGTGRAVGVGLRDITDGTSNTIGVLEVRDELAVIWTQPDDFQPNQDNPLAGLVGLRPNGFQAAFCDGSVRFISEQVDKHILSVLFTRSGGEPVPAF